ncbi:hypothetical protein RQP46_002567 [Phenoliferia psychrophenolica]
MSAFSSLSEHTPLLVRRASSRDDGALEVAPGPDHGSTRDEVILLLKFCVPTYITLMLEMSLFAVTTANVVAFSWMQGMVCALDTLCSQSWTSNPPQTSLHALRTAYLLTLMLIPQIFIFFNSQPILLFLRQDPDVARLASQYLKVLSASLPAYAYFECIKRWLQAQGLMHVPTILVCIVAPINVLLNYLLVWLPKPIGLGFIGAPIAAAISMNLMFAGGVIYCVFFGPREGWGGLSMDAVRNLGDCWKLGMSGVAMTASEWWAFEVLGLAASFLGPAALAANSVVGTAQFVFYQPALAISIAVSVRLGNLLGADRPKQARLVSRIGLMMGFAIGGVNMVFLVLNQRWIGRVFTSSEEVLVLVRQVLADSTAGAAYGIMRGSGKAPMAAVISAISYWLFGIPMSFLLMFQFGYGLPGLWFGLTIGLAIVATGLTVYIGSYLDFEGAAETAQERARDSIDD